MKKFFKTYKEFILTIVIAVVLIAGTCIVGCQQYTNAQGQEVTQLTEGAANALDTASELAPIVQTGLTAAAVAFPALAGLFGLISGIIGAGTAAYKKYQPKLRTEQDKVTLYSNSTKALVYAIEEFKESNGNDWETLKQTLMFELKDKVGPEYFAIIDALRDEFKYE